MTVPANYTFFEFARTKNLDNETLEKVEEYVLQRIDEAEDDYNRDVDDARDAMWEAELERDDAFSIIDDVKDIANDMEESFEDRINKIQIKLENV